ncbi:hypothetical protein BH11BAC5_BH11BAC5_25210 [soil metagenome]
MVTVPLTKINVLKNYSATILLLPNVSEEKFEPKIPQ